MSIRELSPELAQIAKDELGENPARIPEDLKTIKEWLSKQRHINARLDDQWLIAFLRGCKYSLERTKEKLDTFYTMKSAVPELAMGIDPMDPKIQEILKLGVCVPLTKVDPGSPRVVLVRSGCYDPAKFSILDTMRVNQMITDIQLLEDDNTTVVGQRFIIDLGDVTLGHLAQMTPGNIKKMVMSGEDALPLRQKGTHLIHTPQGIETVLRIFRMFMNDKNKSRLFVHNDDMEALYKFVPKKNLPLEYGGEAGPLSEMIDHWKTEIERHRDWFLEDVNYKTDESKRPGKPKTAETLFGTEGSFRQLSID